MESNTMKIFWLSLALFYTCSEGKVADFYAGIDEKCGIQIPVTSENLGENLSPESLIEKFDCCVAELVHNYGDASDEILDDMCHFVELNTFQRETKHHLIKTAMVTLFEMLTQLTKEQRPALCQPFHEQWQSKIPVDEEPTEARAEDVPPMITLPTLPEITAPGLPEITAPRLPKITAPRLPEITAPRLPEITAPRLPEITEPSLPAIVTTDDAKDQRRPSLVLPRFELPNLDHLIAKIPQLPTFPTGSNTRSLNPSIPTTKSLTDLIPRLSRQLLPPPTLNLEAPIRHHLPYNHLPLHLQPHMRDRVLPLIPHTHGLSLIPHNSYLLYPAHLAHQIPATFRHSELPHLEQKHPIIQNDPNFSQ